MFVQYIISAADIPTIILFGQVLGVWMKGGKEMIIWIPLKYEYPDHEDRREATSQYGDTNT